MSGKYKIGKVRKLVDLNKNLINFNLDFAIQSDTKNSTFEIAVVTQDILDNNSPIEYQKATNGHISGNVKSDNNKYNNYLIVMKSDEDMDVSVDLTIHEILHTPPPPPPQQQQQQQQHQQHQEKQENYEHELSKLNNYSLLSNIFTRKNLFIFFIIIILASCAYIYYYMNAKKNITETQGGKEESTSLNPALSGSTSLKQSESIKEDGPGAPDTNISELYRHRTGKEIKQEIFPSDTMKYPNHSRLFESIR